MQGLSIVAKHPIKELEDELFCRACKIYSRGYTLCGFSNSINKLGTEKRYMYEYHIDTFVMGDDW